MLDFSTLPDKTLTTIFANYTGEAPYNHVAQEVNKLGYRVFTKNSLVGRYVSPQDTRRRLKACFKQSSRNPVGRPPTPRDYQLWKIDLITAEDGEIA